MLNLANKSDHDLAIKPMLIDHLLLNIIILTDRITNPLIMPRIYLKNLIRISINFSNRKLFITLSCTDSIRSNGTSSKNFKNHPERLICLICDKTDQIAATYFFIRDVLFGKIVNSTHLLRLMLVT